MLLLFGPVLPTVAQKMAPEGTKVLLLSGGKCQHHGYLDQALYLSATSENTGRYQITICEDVTIPETTTMNKYDLLIVNADRHDDEFKFTLSQQEAIFNYIRQGHGYMSIHAVNNVAKDWPPSGKKCSAECSRTLGCPMARPVRELSSSRLPILGRVDIC